MCRSWTGTETERRSEEGGLAFALFSSKEEECI